MKFNMKFYYGTDLLHLKLFGFKNFVPDQNLF